MSDFIVDASVMIQHLITDNDTAHADALFESVGDTITVYVPEFCLLECANVIWKQVRFQGMAQSQADQLVTDLMALSVSVVSATNLLQQGLQIGLRHQLAVYDSVYIALAKKLTYPLITVDVRQERAAVAEGVSLKALTDFKPLS